MKNSRGKVAAPCIVKTGMEALILNNIGTQQGGPKEDCSSVAICTITPNSKPPATPADEKLTGVPPIRSNPVSVASPGPSFYPVGRGISLPLGQSPPKCCQIGCNCYALINRIHDSNFKANSVLCLDHGLYENSATRDLVLKWNVFGGYLSNFISPGHEATIREFITSA